MNKEEILAKSRKENKSRDLAELEASQVAGNAASIAGMIMCTIMSAVETFLTGKLNFTSWAVFFCIAGTMFLVKYIKLKKKSHLAFAIIELSLCALYIGYYIYRVIYFTSLGAGELL